MTDEIATIIQAGHRDRLTSYEVAEQLMAYLRGKKLIDAEE